MGTVPARKAFKLANALRAASPAASGQGAQRSRRGGAAGPRWRCRVRGARDGSIAASRLAVGRPRACAAVSQSARVRRWRLTRAVPPR